MNSGVGESRRTRTIPREALALLVARHLVIDPEREAEGFSPVRIGMQRLNDLRDRKQIPASEHQQLFYLLESLEDCDLDRCETSGKLIEHVAMSLVLWPEEFPDQELARLRDVLD